MKSSFTKIVKYGKITLGSILTAIAIDCLLQPNFLAVGGVSGLAVVLHHVFGFSTGVITLLINIPLFVLGRKYEGKRFLIRTVYATVVLSLAIDAFSVLPTLTNDLFPSSVFGGFLMGLGMGMVITESASTGGTDIVAKLMKNIFKGVSIGKLLLMIDMAVIAFATLVFKSAEIGFYSAVALFVSTYMIDKTIEGGSFAKTVFIVSDKFIEISGDITGKLNRGVTGLSGVGMYSGEEKTVLMCTLRQREIPFLKRIVEENDKSAFLILTDVREVLGEGFRNKEE